MSQEKIIIWFDADSEPEKWRIHVLRKNNEGEYMPAHDSGNTNFPIDVNAFGAFDEDLLIQSVKQEFPGADISLKFS
ncbi:MAG: hypothetical protein HGB00_06965 [Chlorobiaceae bacterium]|nr:hypothetical protein [Chlorobiaceae bacterium]